MGLGQIGEVVEQLRLGEGVDPQIEIRPGAADCPRVGLDRLGLQTLELEVFQMLVVVLFESSRGGVLVHLASAS